MSLLGQRYRKFLLSNMSLVHWSKYYVEVNIKGMWKIILCQRGILKGANSALLQSCCCCCSVAKLYPTCDPMNCSTPGSPVLYYLPEFAQIHIHWASDAIQPSHSLLSPSPPTFHLSQDQSLFQWVSSSHRWPKYWGFSFSTSPANDYSGLISFRIDWFYLLPIQGTLKSLLQYHSSKASILNMILKKVYSYSY